MEHFSTYQGFLPFTSHMFFDAWKLVKIGHFESRFTGRIQFISTDDLSYSNVNIGISWLLRSNQNIKVKKSDGDFIRGVFISRWELVANLKHFVDKFFSKQSNKKSVFWIFSKSKPIYNSDITITHKSHLILPNEFFVC